MQIIKASRDAILKPLQTVAGIVEKRHTLPILANVLIRKEGEVVSFTGTDIEMQVQTRASVGSGDESSAVTVSARKLIDILRALPEGEVTVDLKPQPPTPWVPNAALHRRDGQLGVWRLEGDDEPRFIPVERGLSDLDGRIQILAGLSPGDRVVMHSRSPLSPSSRIEIRDAIPGVPPAPGTQATPAPGSPR